MRCKAFLSPLLAITCAAALFADDTENTPKAESCGESPRSIRLTARHIEANGIGYNQGYTTVEGFISPWYKQSPWVPFLDLRGHVFNDGKLASNAGIGCRYIARSWVYGINAYYDYRNTKRQHYNQVSSGLEMLGRIWDFRINGYLPVGWKNSPFFDTGFDGFKDHNFFIRRKRDVALKAVNAEAGMHVDHYANAPFYFAAGPYYLTGSGKTSWGGSLRAAVDLYKYVTLEANTSYDELFHWIGQGQVSINFPLGPKRKVQKGNHSSCGQAIALSKRAVQRVDRMEIIPIKREHKRSKAINPNTDEPWIVWFVNNTSSSNGTFESPFPTLVQAQNASSPNQIIYVFPGDGTTNGMNAGITLQNAQLFLGASVEHPLHTTVGAVTIPSMASSAPSIVNPAGNAVTLSSYNTVSGFTITIPTNGNNGIFGNGITNFKAFHNTFVTSTAITTNGISLINPSGQVLANNSLFNGFSNNVGGLNVNGNGIYVQLDAGNMLNELSANANTFVNINNPMGAAGGNGIYANIKGGSINSLNVSDSLFNAINVGAGIFVQNAGGTLNTCNFSNNSFNNIVNFGLGVAFFNRIGGKISEINGTGNVFNNLNNSFGISISNSASINDVNFSSNTFSDINNGGSGMNFLATGIAKLSILRNSFSGGAGITTGYAVSLSVSNGNQCLQFLNNSASPSVTPAPYQFSQSGSGVFNRTVGSDNSTNMGTITTSGNVGASGSCSN